jgi:transposase-like protein
LYAVIMEAYVHGVSTRNVDDLVAALGAESGISKSQVSRICFGLDAEIARFRERTLTHTGFPYVFLDARYCKVRIGAHGVSHALVVATGVSIDGTREVLGTAVGDSESFDFCREFLTGLKARSLSEGASGDLRRACWVEICCGAAVHRCIGAAVQGAFHAECGLGRVVEAFAAGDGGDQDGLRAH